MNEKINDYTVLELQEMGASSEVIFSRIENAIINNPLHPEFKRRDSSLELMRILGVSQEMLNNPVFRRYIGRLSNRIVSEVAIQTSAENRSHEIVNGTYGECRDQLIQRGIDLRLSDNVPIVIKYRRSVEQSKEPDYVAIYRIEDTTIIRGAYSDGEMILRISPEKVTSVTFTGSDGSLEFPEKNLLTAEFSLLPDSKTMTAIFQGDTFFLGSGDRVDHASKIEQHLLTLDGNGQIARKIETLISGLIRSNEYASYGFRRATMQRDIIRNELELEQERPKLASSFCISSDETYRNDWQVESFKNRGKPEAEYTSSSVSVISENGWNLPNMPYFGTNQDDITYCP